MTGTRYHIALLVEVEHTRGSVNSRTGGPSWERVVRTLANWLRPPNGGQVFGLGGGVDIRVVNVAEAVAVADPPRIEAAA
jgi:hypothetical protein